MSSYVERTLAAFERLESENAKLRELVRIAGTYCVNGLCGKDDGCPLYLGKPYCALPDRMSPSSPPGIRCIQIGRAHV